MDDETLKTDMLSLIRMRERDIAEVCQIWKHQKPERLSALIMEMVKDGLLVINPQGSKWFFAVPKPTL
jgi:hypothetical protein